jgi:dihydrofolate reductase
MLSIIAAVSENNALGKENKLLWHLPADLKRLKSLTMGHHLIMGRKTFESLGKPLPGRPHVIISRQKNYQPDGVTVVDSLEKAIEFAKHDDQAFVFGGGEIYRLALPFVKKIYLTRVKALFEGDTYFPELISDEWKMVKCESYLPDEKNLFYYSFEEYNKAI